MGHRVLALLALVLLLSACDGVTVATPVPTTMTIAGATAARPVLRELTAAFTKQYPDTLFDLRGGGSTLGEAAVHEGRADLAASSLLPETDPQTGLAVDDGLQRVPFALDGIAIVVHPTNDVDALSLVQLRDLYAGNVIDWSQVGAEGEVLLVSREEGSGSRITFEDRVMGETAVSLAAVVMPTSADVVDYVAQTPHAIGYVSMAYVAGLAGEMAGTPEPPVVKVVRLEGALPTAEAVGEQRYPLVTPLYLVSLGEPQGRIRQFTDFVVSPAGQAIVAGFHAPIRP